jgi:hypothetical protein
MVVGSGTNEISVSVEISGLDPETTYHYRIVASSSAGTVYGADTTFTTASATGASCIVDITGIRLTGTLEVNSPITFSVETTHDCTDEDIYHRFDLIPYYATDDYDPDNDSQIIQDFSTDNNCIYTFAEAGSYVVVASASFTTSIPTGAAPIIGGSFVIGGSGGVALTSLNISPTGTIQVGDSATFTASATLTGGGEVYYRFDLIPDYGTSDYDAFNNWQTIQEFSTASSCTYTFNESGSYIIVVWASPIAEFPSDEAPQIIGGSVTVE